MEDILWILFRVFLISRPPSWLEVLDTLLKFIDWLIDWLMNTKEPNHKDSDSGISPSLEAFI